jgi:uncharacterized protein YjiK
VLTTALLLAVLCVTPRTARAGADLEEWPLPQFPEPSGIVYHPGRDTLFIVGDQGDIAEISTAGKLLVMRNVGGDLESVTCDPGTGLLYAVREGHEILFEIDPDSLKFTRRFTIDRSYEGNVNFLERGGDGIEGLTFRPVPGHPEGGRFFAVNQFDPPVLIELEVPLKTAPERFAQARIIAAHPIGSPPLSGVTWDEASGAFLIVSAVWRSVWVTDENGGRLRSVRIPGFMQEGIEVLPDGSFVIVQDTGGLVKWNPPGNPFTDGGDQASASEKVAKGSKTND